MMSKKIRISSKIENIYQIERLVDEINLEFKLSHDIYGNILVSVLEAVTNSIKHGNRLDENKFVEIDFEHNDDIFIFTILDEGQGFDYTNLPDPTSVFNVEKPHGRGIFLMIKLSDETIFEEEGRKVILKFKK